MYRTPALALLAFLTGWAWADTPGSQAFDNPAFDHRPPSKSVGHPNRSELLELLAQRLPAPAIVELNSRGATGDFVNWESPHVYPLDLTPDGLKLLAVNTADNRLEVFDVSAGTPNHVGAVTVGLDPVSVRARGNAEAWVVNHVSDTISVVDLQTLRVTRTINTGDEPADVVFAGTPQRAFVSVSQLNQVRVYDPANLTAVPTILTIAGEDPRGLATDGTRVFVAVFESGNRTTILGEDVVSSAVNPYAGDANPPPNAGSGFSPLRGPNVPTPPRVSLIVKKDAGGVWRDDNNGNWSAAVTWNLHDHDVAIIQSGTLAVTYARSLMNINMGIAVRPDGRVTVIGTDARNEIRFSPNVRGTFLRVVGAAFDPSAPAAAPSIDDMNPHLGGYSTPSVPPATRALSIGDPRAIVWRGAGGTGFVAGMGSNNVIAVDSAFARIATIPVDQGPTGLALDEARGRLYALCRFDGTIATIDTSTNAVLQSDAFYDPTPVAIRTGRPHLYDTHRGSGLGHMSCGSCHVDARMDQVAWDLGNPAGEVKPFNQNCNFGVGGCENWHPMKGPMTTQTLFGIVGTEPLHWRGDREDLAAFNGAFDELLATSGLSPTELVEFEDYVATLTFPPNPFRNFDGSLPTTFSNGGNPASGLTIFQQPGMDGGVLSCAQCHALPTGTNGIIISGPALQETQSMKVPQLRNMYEKTGFSAVSAGNNRGFGFIHDGSVDTLFEFLQFSGFNFGAGATGQQRRRDVEAFMFCLATDTHAAVGTQTTVLNGAAVPAPQSALITNMLNLANANTVGVVVKGRVNGAARGYAYLGGGQFQSDRAGETMPAASLVALAATGQELTYTVVPFGSQTRIGLDRDLDAHFDRTEVEACSDPADPLSTPGSTGLVLGDLNGDGLVTVSDIGGFVAVLTGVEQGFEEVCKSDINQDGVASVSDIGPFVALVTGA